MSSIFLILQGGFFGYVAVQVVDLESSLGVFLGLCLVNSVLVVLHGATKAQES
jgi:hypothetical protein